MRDGAGCAAVQAVMLASPLVPPPAPAPPTHTLLGNVSNITPRGLWVQTKTSKAPNPGVPHLSILVQGVLEARGHGAKHLIEH